jgi:hypothetical protein
MKSKFSEGTQVTVKTGTHSNKTGYIDKIFEELGDYEYRVIFPNNDRALIKEKMLEVHVKDEVFMESPVGRDNPVSLRTVGNEKYFPPNTTILLPDGLEGYISNNHPITDIEIFAGKGGKWEIENDSAIKALIKRHKDTKKDDWKRGKANGYVRQLTDIESKPAEIHWWECGKYGPQLRKVHKWL